MDKNTSTRKPGLGRLYVVEGWNAGLECVGWRSGAQARSVGRLADEYALDRGAIRVYVRRESATGTGTDLVAEWNETGGWKSVQDERLEAQFAAEGRG